MYLGYNTNGLPGHRFEDALKVLSEIGYRGVAITLDHHLLDPYGPDLDERIRHVRRLLERYSFSSVIETGARFLLDRNRKHQPTLLSESAAGRARRVDFLIRCVEVGAALGSEAVSFWSGTPDRPMDDQTALERLVEGCRHVLDRAEKHELRIGFEPEPGMWVDTMSRFAELDERIDHELFQLTLDVGHVHCLESETPAQVIREWGNRVVNVHLDDMKRGVHEHLAFGDGEIEFEPVIQALRDVSYGSGVFVELPRHGHDAVRTAEQSFAFLKPLLGD